MLRFRDLLNFPPFYSKRNKSIKTVPIRIDDVKQEDTEEEQYIEISGSSNKYSQKIRVNGRFNHNAYVQITCNCPSFTFEFSHSNLRNGSLLNPETFGKEVIKRPSEKNKHMIPSGCKHIIALANLFNSQKNRYI
jgi:hypothetical protein